MNYWKEYLMVILTAIRIRAKEIKHETIFGLIITGAVIFLVFSSIIHWDKYCSIEECLEESKEYCEDLNKWCKCWNGKLDCDVNMVVECDYLCDLNENF